MDIDEAEAEGSKSLVLKIYGPDLGPKLAYAAGYGRGYNYRKVLEPTDATTQCEKSGHELTNDTVCYMCGLRIPDKATMQAKKSADELWPECEHILPLTEGRWFLDIYITNRVQTDPWSSRARHLEYDQAHRVCNQAKRIMSYITKHSDGTVSVSPGGIKDILTEVVKRANRNIANGDTRPMMRSIAGMDIPARVAVIARRVQELVTHINSALPQAPGAEGLDILARSALLADPVSLLPGVRAVHDEWYSNREQQLGIYNEKLTAFIHETEAAYPTLATRASLFSYLAKVLTRGDTERAYLDSILPPSLDLILRRIFDAMSGVDIQLDTSGAHFLSLVYYGLYATLYEQLQPKEKDAQRLRCDVYRRMHMILNLPGPKDDRGRDTAPLNPRPSAVFGEPPLSPADAAVCKRFDDVDARELREYLRAEEEKTAPLVDSIVYHLKVSTLPAVFAKFGLPIPSDMTALLAYVQKAISTYAASFPDSTYAMQVVAARAIAEKPEIRILLLRQGISPETLQEAILSDMPFARGAGRRKRKTYRRTSKRRKTLRKRIRA